MSFALDLGTHVSSGSLGRVMEGFDSDEHDATGRTSADHRATLKQRLPAYPLKMVRTALVRACAGKFMRLLPRFTFNPPHPSPPIAFPRPPCLLCFRLTYLGAMARLGLEKRPLLDVNTYEAMVLMPAPLLLMAAPAPVKRWRGA